MLYPESLERLIEQFQKLPTIGKKSAQRLALYMLDQPAQVSQAFAQALLDVQERIHPCARCGNYTEQDICSICADVRRDQASLCVVEDVPNLMAFERSGTYRGLYHVLGGTLSPEKDRGPEEIGIDRLIDRIQGGDFKEVILAISPTVEGETTTLFVAELLKPLGVKVTRLASGIPMGGNLEYFDEMTLYRALEDRRRL